MAVRQLAVGSRFDSCLAVPCLNLKVVMNFQIQTLSHFSSPRLIDCKLTANCQLSNCQLSYKLRLFRSNFVHLLVVLVGHAVRIEEGDDFFHAVFHDSEPFFALFVVKR